MVTVNAPPVTRLVNATSGLLTNCGAGVRMAADSMHPARVSRLATNRYSGPPVIVLAKLMSSTSTRLGIMLNWHRVMKMPACTASSASNTRGRFCMPDLRPCSASRRIRCGYVRE